MKLQQNLSGHRAHIVGPRVELRILLPSDASEKYASWLNDPETNKYLETRSVTLPELREYIAEKDQSAEALFFGVFWKEGDNHIGNVKLEPINCEEGWATMGILIGDGTYRGCGVGTEVTDLITNYAFKELGLQEARLGVISENRAAIRVYEKCGYVVEAVEEKTINHDGVLFDRIRMKKTCRVAA